MAEVIHSLLEGLSAFTELQSMVLFFIGIVIGLVFGVLPGLSGLTALAVLLPFTYGMEPATAFMFLLAAHAVVYTGGSITAILLNIPGTPPNAATLIDGYPMTRKGLAGRAIGNALTASACGGVIGGFVLISLLFVVRPLVMAFGLPEYFLVILLGLCFIGVLGRGSPFKGLLSAVMGIFASCVGIHPLTGEPRLWFGSSYLLQGFGIIPVALGLFAFPELIRLFGPSSLNKQREELKVNITGTQVWEGVKDVFRHKWLLLQSSAIGTIVGIIPGIGGEVAPFIAYGVAKSTSSDSSKFGQGCPEGVIAPESSNNAKEGGALLPTLAFGIPGSSGMALLLGAFLILGLKPGPFFLKDHLPIAFTMAYTVIFANVLGAAILMPIAAKFSRVAYMRPTVLGPLIVVMVILGSFAYQGSLWDSVCVFFFGVIGFLMDIFQYNRPAFFLAYILGNLAERYLGLTLRTHGLMFFSRPVSLVLVLMIVLCLFIGLRKRDSNSAERSGSGSN